MESLIKALVQARKGFKAIAKDRKNPHFGSTYATLDSVLDAVTPALCENGLTVIQTINPSEDGRLMLTTALWHESGQSISSAYPLTQDANPQKFGAALTYARRYSICALLNVTADEDDDGNAASKQERSQQPKQSQPAPQRPKGLITEPEKKRLWAIAKGTGYSKEAMSLLIQMEYGFNTSSDITTEKYDAVVEMAQNPEIMAHYNQLAIERAQMETA